MSLFESMLNLASKIQAKTLNTSFPLLTSYLDDINVRDRDVVMNDMQAGDVWLWVLKSNGCGTYLLLLDGDMYSGFDKRIAEEGTKTFLIRVSGQDEGTIKPIKSDTAIGMLDKPYNKKNRVPRRLYADVVFAKLLDLSASGYRLSDTRFWCDFTVVGGDVSYIKLNQTGSNISFVVNRVVFTLSRSDIKKSLYYQFPVTDKLRELLCDGDKFFKFTASDNCHGAIEEVNQAEYDDKTKLLIAA